ncbi:MAG: F510_1955 family glycosylhydrolase [Burkholderiales bacterium]
MRSRRQPILVFALLLAALPGALYEARAQSTEAVTLTHVHGLAYSADGKQLMVPSHHGLAIYRDGKWSKAPGPAHDYMGFAAARTRLYSSGHPAPGSGLVNPFGLVRSGDGGKTWDKLSLEGESDFHLLAASWNTNAVYVWNAERNSRMASPGLHFTLNDGFMWQRAAAKGLAGKPRALAVHPDDGKVVAVATSSGIYLSRNSGDSFEPVARKGEGLTVFFDLDGKRLWHSIYDGGPRLARTALRGGGDISIALPPLTNDAVAYVAQNPAEPGEYAIATFERSVYVTRDSGQTWRQIARNGEGL